MTNTTTPTIAETNPVELLILSLLIVAEAVATAINLTNELMQGHSILTPSITVELPSDSEASEARDSVAPLQAMTVAELRKIARAAGQSRSWCRVARKADLVALLAVE